MEFRREANLDQTLEQSSDEVPRDGYADQVSTDTNDPKHLATCVEALPFPSWQVPYLNALLEFDPKKLGGRIFAAVVAILARSSQMVITEDPSPEQQAINDALDALAGLTRCKRWSNKLPNDVNQCAALTVLSSTEVYPEESVKECLARIGLEGGLRDGKTGATRLPTGKRKTIAKKAAAT